MGISQNKAMGEWVLEKSDSNHKSPCIVARMIGSEAPKNLDLIWYLRITLSEVVICMKPGHC